jgi:hypothetical protein
MIATNQWTESLACPHCGIKGVAHFSQPQNHAFDSSVDATPEGFKVVSLKFGETFYCQTCDRPAQTR